MVCVVGFHDSDGGVFGDCCEFGGCAGFVLNNQDRREKKMGLFVGEKEEKGRNVCVRKKGR